MTDQRVEVSCQGCGRTSRLAPSILARKDRCQVCGGALSIPEEAQEGIRSLAKEVPTAQIRVDCPICFRTTAQVDDPGATCRCSFCGCPFVVQDQDGTAEIAPPPEPEFESHEDFTCGACGENQQLPRERYLETSNCRYCATPFPFGLEPDELPERREGMEALSRQLAQKRWKEGRMSLAEARSHLDRWRRLVPWYSRPSSADCPLPAYESLQVLQNAVLGVAQAELVPADSGEDSHLRIPLRANSKDDGLGRLLLINAIGVGLNAAVGVGWVSFEGEKDDEVVQQEELIITASLHGTETHFDFCRQTPDGEVLSLREKEEGDLRERVANLMDSALLRWCLAASLVGDHLVGNLFLYLTPKFLESRIADLGPEWGDAFPEIRDAFFGKEGDSP